MTEKTKKIGFIYQMKKPFISQNLFLKQSQPPVLSLRFIFNEHEYS
jgi:hypothetical protein